MCSSDLQLTDPAFGSLSASVEGRLFTLRRSDLVLLVNAGETEVSVDVDAAEVLFETPSGVTLDDGTVTLPPHGGALLRSA